jgi:lipoprotein-anchoring transpeptidase ErfK/SrfK
LDVNREFLEKYPTVREGGKTYKIIPNEDILMREDVAVPPAPDGSHASIHVNLAKKRAWLYRNGSLAHTSPVCTGKTGFETPTGVFRVIAKHQDWVSTLYHVPMPFFLRLNADDGKVGLHSGAIALEPASHGCIRLPRNMAETFFEESPVGTRVVVVSGDEGEFL